MPSYEFRGKPVASWTESDVTDFKSHILNDKLACTVSVPSGQARPVRGHVKNIFDSTTFRGQSGSPFEWHREVKSRMEQADLITEDLAMLRDCVESGKFGKLDEATNHALCEAMADKMAAVRYGYMAGNEAGRAADYKQQMTMTMEFGSVRLIQDDIAEWKSGMQELLNSEYSKAFTPGSRYVCRFFTRDDKGKDFDVNHACAFYDSDLLTNYIEEYISNKQAGFQAGTEKAPVRDLYKFTTAPGDYDLRYKITKAAAVAQGIRIMSKEDWVNNSKAQAAYAKMGGWGLTGDKYAISEDTVAKAQPGEMWLAESQARVDRANKLYEHLEALAELPLDTHGSLKYQPSFQTCVRCGWVSKGSSQDKAKSVPKEREAQFHRELLLRAVDAMYGQNVAALVESDFRNAAKIPPKAGEDKNVIQQVWDDLKAGRFDAVQERVVTWAGERMDVIGAEVEAKEAGASEKFNGQYHGRDVGLYSDAGAVACMQDILFEQAAGVMRESDGLVNLPAEDMNLMYEVCSVKAEVTGQAPKDFDSWCAELSAKGLMPASLNEFLSAMDAKSDGAGPVKLAKEVYDRKPEVPKAPEISEQAAFEMETEAAFDAMAPEGYAMTQGMEEAFASADMEAFVSSGVVPSDKPVEPVYRGQMPSMPAEPKRDMSDLDAAAGDIEQRGQGVEAQCDAVF